MNETIVNKLRAYCKQQQDIVLAFLFGSQAKGYARPASDWDMGVYLTDSGITHKQEIWRDLEKIVHAEIDLVVLNNAPARIAWPIIGSGIELAIKDHDRYMQEIEHLSEEADAWYQTTYEYYKIFNRSASLSQRDRARLQEITTFLDSALREYARFRALTQEQYMSETDVKRSVEHWIEHLINAAVDIAKIIWASERRPIPETYKEFLIALGSVTPFNENNACRKLAEWTYLRNALSHEYLDYRFKEIMRFVNETSDLFTSLTAHTKTFLDANPKL